MASSANASVNATSPWYASIEVYSSDYEPASFEPGPSVDANHNLLAGLRDNDFEMTNSSYTVSFAFKSGPAQHRTLQLQGVELQDPLRGRCF